MKIDLDKIVQNENSRVIYKESDLSELMGSMKEHGLLQPVGVRRLKNNQFESVFGNRRIMAAKRLEWANIEAVLVEAETDTDRDILNLVENIKRRNTTLAEDGRMFKILKDRGLNENEISRRLDIPTQRIRTALEVVAEVPASYQNIMPNKAGHAKRKGLISPAVTNELLRIRKTYNLKRGNFRQLLDAAKDGMTVNHIREVAPHLDKGTTMAIAITQAEAVKHIALEMYINRKEIEIIEKRTGAGVRQYLFSVLKKNSNLGSLRPRSGTGIKE